MKRVPYDAFADIYDVWVASAPVTGKNQAYYVDKLVESEGPVVELGVGNGRITVEVARRGKDIVGVDFSTAMLELCHQRAEQAGVAERITLVEGDFRDFELPEPARLITIPFHSIGHLLTEDDKRSALRHIHGQLSPGGRLIFDHFIFNSDYPLEDGVPHLRAEYIHPENGRDHFLWETIQRDMEQQIIRIIVWTDEIDAHGTVVSRRYRRNSVSWLRPEQSRDLLEDTGFRVEAVYGDFDESPLGDSSPQQIWVGLKAH